LPRIAKEIPEAIVVACNADTGEYTAGPLAICSRLWTKIP